MSKCVLTFCLIFGFATQINAAGKAPDDQGFLNRLLAPGPLSAGHKDMESSGCLKCHTTSKNVVDKNCTSCHKDISAAKKRGRGFHGRVKKRCSECHSEHKGRIDNSININQRKFDHDRTGYSLRGSHAKISCNKCHTKKRTGKLTRTGDTRYFGQFSRRPSTCKECHQKDSSHNFIGTWGKKDCKECHNDTSFKNVKSFNHFRATGFNLTGSHSDLKCQSCHAKTKGGKTFYQRKLRKNLCTTCHKNNHNGKMSSKFASKSCLSCHNNTTWKIPRFDHSMTGFNLTGKHTSLKCVSCHKQRTPSTSKNIGSFVFKGLNRKCTSCHTDKHQFKGQVSKRFGTLNNCTACHSTNGWKTGINFNHSIDTRFPLLGKHKALSCKKCHGPTNKRKNLAKGEIKYNWPNIEQKTCETCHKNSHKNNPTHKSKKVRCSKCHVPTSFSAFKTKKGLFDHNINTRFPMSGKHKSLDCKRCHEKNGKKRYRFGNSSKKFCNSCHKNPHKKQFHRKFANKSCAECHTTKTFKRRKAFDHSKTRFKHSGKHIAIQKKCGKCHTKTKRLLGTTPPRYASKFVFKNLNSKLCRNCHKNVHKKQFHKSHANRECGDCHTTKSFKKRKPIDHSKMRFPLRGKHQTVACSKCHVKTKKLLLKSPKRRASQFKFPRIYKDSCVLCHRDEHAGKMVVPCSSCHTEKGWDITRNFHKNYPLEGVHATLKCAECHIGDRRLRGVGSDCVNCHMKDNIHRGTLLDCEKCHSQVMWEFRKFNHSTTSFPLTGAHRTLNCDTCHRGGTYVGTPTDCIMCHINDSQSVLSPTHVSPEFDDCSGCHNPFSFSNPIEQ